MSRSPSPWQQPPSAWAVSVVSLKLPPFRPADLQVWFAQVEAQFKTWFITSQRMKYDHIVASLSPEVATDVWDLILKPPDANPFDELKTVMIKHTAESEQRRLQQLLVLRNWETVSSPNFYDDYNNCWKTRLSMLFSYASYFFRGYHQMSEWC